MSEKLCALRKIGGGTLKETTLWTNPNPTSAMDTTNVDLPDSMYNYDFLKLYWRISTTDGTTSSIIFNPSEFSIDGVKGNIVGFATRPNNGATTYNRYIIPKTSTSVVLTRASERTTGTDNYIYGIPTMITGCKL